jgi:hypothetical protein
MTLSANSQHRPIFGHRVGLRKQVPLDYAAAAFTIEMVKGIATVKLCVC